ncbi:Alginate lyase 2 [Dillenia turbinata]|uniref:Alginate lyase 2 n=1 Tax=Dillenia turbinata TaxID=194707 RepID=A0AAN8ZJM3_9MAGN
MISSYSYLLIFLACLCVVGCSADPTDGFTSVPLTEWNFELQKPYDKPLNERYSYENCVRKLWVYSDDKPHQPGSNTKPRTEIRIRGLDYSSGIWQFEAYGFVPSGTSGVSLVQIHGAESGATTMQIRIYNGDLRYYSTDLIASDMYDKWFRVNVIHDVDEGKVTFFIDGVQKLQEKDHRPGDLYFKCGVYAQNNDSYYMESRWREIKIYKKMML